MLNLTESRKVMAGRAIIFDDDLTAEILLPHEIRTMGCRYVYDIEITRRSSQSSTPHASEGGILSAHRTPEYSTPITSSTTSHNILNPE